MLYIKDVLDVVLEDDETGTGGVSFVGETVADFILETELAPDDTLVALNQELHACGIKQLLTPDSDVMIAEMIEQVANMLYYIIGEELIGDLTNTLLADFTYEEITRDVLLDLAKQWFNELKDKGYSL